MQDFRYLQYKHSAFMTAVRQGRIDRLREIISSRGPCYEEEWNDGYFLLCIALEEKHTEVAKLLLTSGSEVNSEFENPCDTPLHSAALNGDVEIVQMLLDRDANINAENQDRKTALHNAVETMNTEIIGMLLSKEANVDAADKSGVTPLHLAIKNNSKEITNLLLSRGANVEGKTSGPSAADKGDGTTPLHLAVGNGNKEITRLLLSKGANVNARRNDDITSLHIATHEGCIKIVENLLKYGADVHSISRNSETPLYFAIENEHENIVQLLLECGANVDAEDKDNKTMLQLAVEKGSSIFVENILKHRPDLNNRSNSSVLNIAAQGCGIEYEKIVNYLLRYGFKVNPNDAKNFIHAALKNGHLELVEELLIYVTDVNMICDSSSGINYVPLHVASTRNRVGVAELLINYGANINAEGCTGMTALHFAAQSGHEEVVKLLLKFGANVNAATKFDFKTPLHLAFEFGYLEIVKRLLEFGAKVASTLFHLAVKNGNIEIVKLFLKYGADVHSLPRNSETPLYIAIENGYENIVQLLLECGANVDAEDKDNKTVLQLAVEKGSSIFVENILKHRPDLNNRSNSSVLNIAAQGCGIEYEKIVNYLLRYGFTVNPKDAENFIHAAVKNGHLELVKKLLEYVTDVNKLRDSSSMISYVPLHVASIRNRVGVAELLINYGANINAEDCTGMTALHFATQSGHEEFVELLLTFRANVNAATRFNFKTPLHLAVEFGHIEIVKLLLKFGANVDSTDEDGATALHFASTKGHEEVVTTLLEHGSDITLKSKNGYTAFDLDICGRKSFSDIHYVHGCDFDIYFNSDHDHEAITSMNNARILERHMIKIKAANLYAVYKYVLSSSIADKEQSDFMDEYDKKRAHIYSRQSRKEEMARYDFQDRCEREVASMKSEKFVNTCVTFYDILIKDINQLVMYARNESIIGAFKSCDYKKKFPIYGSMISINFRKGERRKELLEQGNKILDVLFNDFPELPRGCTERILSYLNDDDLRTLMEADMPYVKEKCSNRRWES